MALRSNYNPGMEAWNDPYAGNDQNEFVPSYNESGYQWQPPPPAGSGNNGGIFTGDTSVTGPNGPTQMSDPQYAAMLSAAFGQGGSASSGGVSASAPGGYAAPAPSAGSTTQTPSLMNDFSTALRTLINGPSPKQAGMDVLKSAPVTAFNANAKRNEARDRQFLAERAASGGYSGSGGFESGVLGLRGRTNEAMDRFAGEQAQIEQQGRRQELLQALQMAMAFGDAEAARNIQRELGLANVDTQRYGINVGRETALDQLGYNYANMQNGLNNSLFDWIFSGGR